MRVEHHANGSGSEEIWTAECSKCGDVYAIDGYVDFILVGRNPSKLQQLAKTHDVERITIDLDAALADLYNTIYFDARITSQRADTIKRAIAARKHVYY